MLALYPEYVYSLVFFTNSITTCIVKAIHYIRPRLLQYSVFPVSYGAFLLSLIATRETFKNRNKITFNFRVKAKILIMISKALDLVPVISLTSPITLPLAKSILANETSLFLEHTKRIGVSSSLHELFPLNKTFLPEYWPQINISITREIVRNANSLATSESN